MFALPLEWQTSFIVWFIWTFMWRDLGRICLDQTQDSKHHSIDHTHCSLIECNEEKLKSVVYWGDTIRMITCSSIYSINFELWVLMFWCSFITISTIIQVWSCLINIIRSWIWGNIYFCFVSKFFNFTLLAII